MEDRGRYPGPGGPASRMGLEDLPDELLFQILRELEDEYVESGQTSATFLQLRTVSKKLKRGVDLSISNLSRGIGRNFCNKESMRKARRALQRQLARWSTLRRLQLQVRGPYGFLKRLLPALGQSCPGLGALCVERSQHLLESLESLRICHSLAHLTSLTSLECLSLTGFRTRTGTLPFLPSLRTIEVDFQGLLCPAPPPSLEVLVFGREPDDLGFNDRTRSLDMPLLHTLPRLRCISLVRVSLEDLRLPSSLQTLNLVDIRPARPVDLSQDLPELVELLLVHRREDRFPVDPQGLSTLLSRGHLRRLRVHGRRVDDPHRLTIPETLTLETGLTSLSLQSVHVPCVPELSATLTALTELKLVDLRQLEAIDVSRLNLQDLRLMDLPVLHSIEGLGLQACLTSLVLVSLDSITHLPGLRTLRGLKVLELQIVRLDDWTSDCISAMSSLKRLVMSGIRQLAPQAAPSAAPAHPRPRLRPPAVTPMLELGASRTLTELDLHGLGGTAIDLAPMLVAESVSLHGCTELAHLSGIHSLPCLRSLHLTDPMPKLRKLNIASCPRLTTVSLLVKGLWHLTMEDLPLLQCLPDLPRNLRTVHVAACRSLKSLGLENLPYLASLDLTGVPQLRLQRLKLWDARGLRNVKLDGLAMLSSLSIGNCKFIKTVHVSGSPLTKIVLKSLPKLLPSKLHINDLYLHGADSPLVPSPRPLPPPTATHQAPPGPPPVHPAASGSSSRNAQALRSLSLVELPGRLTLAQVALHTGLTELKLGSLHVSELPSALASLSALSKLVLMDLTVDHVDPLLPDSFSQLEDLTVSGRSDALHWTGLRTGLSYSGSPARVDGGLVGCEVGVGPFRSITKLLLSELGVDSLDVSQLASTQELTVSDCQSLTRLSGIAGLSSLKMVRLVDIPKLQKVAVLSCPKLEVVGCILTQLLHLHMEDLPSLKRDAFCLHNRGSTCCLASKCGCWPGYQMESLESLTLRGLPNVSRLFVNGLKSLASVEMTHCPSLNGVNLETLDSLTSLRLSKMVGEGSGEASSSGCGPPQESQCMRHVSLIGMPMLKSIWWPSVPQNVVIRSCSALTSLPLDRVESLEHLELQDVADEVLPVWLKQARRLKKMEFGRSSVVD